jgi:DNA-binding NarL/FixJ family response regulator
LGLSTQVRTALSEAEVMARLAERPADVVLADTALTRPDTVGFTRRVLARSPGSVLVLFGAEDPRVAAAAVAAGARALIRGTDDLVSTVAKAVLLLGVPTRPAGVPSRSPQPASAARGTNAPARFGAQPPGSGRNPGPSASGEEAPGALDALGDERPGLYDPAGGQPAGAPGTVAAGAVGPPGAANAGGQAGRGMSAVPSQRGDFGDPAEAGGRPARANGEPGFAAPAARRVVLTERELQVLRGMADGKSNAEIGRELFVSEDTVKTHARRLFRKLGARDRAHAVAAGFRAGLVV